MMNNASENDAKLTPLLRQYLDIKNKYRDEILFFRLGDFYEMFFDDAKKASSTLDIVLTRRQNDVPMCGVPFHAAENYISRLIKAGYKVAICEQMETVPSSGNIVRREVVRIITPGTLVESGLLQTEENNFLASVVVGTGRIGLAFLDVSTGDFFLSEIDKSFDLYRGEITRFNPREVVIKNSLPDDEIFSTYLESRNIPTTYINEWLYDVEYLSGTIRGIFSVANLKGLAISTDMEVMAAGSILEYVKDAQKKSINHLKFPQRVIDSSFMVLDEATINNLELVQNTQDRTRAKTLYSILNHTKTAMGKRLLERNILQPLTDVSKIGLRLDSIERLIGSSEMRTGLADALKHVQDMERILSRFSIGKVFPKDFQALSSSIKASSDVKRKLSCVLEGNLSVVSTEMPDLSELAETIDNSITDDPAVSPESGRIIREGLNDDLDHLYELKNNSKDWAVRYQEEERKKNDISSLKIRHNRVFGYYIEVSNTHLSKVPTEYLRKQTLVNAERYTTKELQKFETEILTASEKIVEIESMEIERLKNLVIKEKNSIQRISEAVAEIDFYYSLATSAIENNFIRPRFNGEKMMSVKSGRHPMVEKYFTKEVFIPNDIYFDGKDHTVKIITGPNMSGKSTYIRMCAVIQLLGQIGSFVPAEEADLSIVDRIFTRIGASDNISRGESTFLVEMNEAATILNNATDRSLIVMDEVGRGTSTYDGYSLARAIIEYILNYIRAKTLFATHYHELTEMEEKNSGAVNYNVMVREHIHGIDFLHKIVRGAADKSYGIYVAKLAGVPKEVTSRAQKILDRIEKATRKNIKGEAKSAEPEGMEQFELFNAANHRVIQAIKQIDVDRLTPIDALNEINRLKKMID